ncbi:HHIP-like protein 2 isoform X2 [Acanthaster planci]|uniref:HHIP-like protein 2 isoform X2 n=1 Tax=Acanthaster planci TaxID=133434 RepID=A0A8B7Y379_ACAPL|nr:HHIP-like protein 2 isoform X2 [Acanthaster planci]
MIMAALSSWSVSSFRAALVSSFIAAACLSTIQICIAHPQCLDFFPPFDHDADQRPEFCTLYNRFGCCTRAKDLEIQQKYEEVAEEYERVHGKLSSDCLDFLKDILCQECSPYAAHLYDAETTQQRSRQLPGLCNGYCTAFHSSCSQLLPFITTEEPLRRAATNSAAVFCDKMAIPDIDYCFPDVLASDDLSQWVEEAQSGTGRGQCLCLEEFANGLQNPLLAIHANDNTHRFFIAEQIGIIHVFLENKTRLAEPFLDIRDSVLTSSRRGDERGLLGAAFHPNFTLNSKFYVYYSSGSSSDQIIRISEFTVMPEDMNKIDVQSEKVILEVGEPYANHNGGQLMFGLDGYLYASIGDGGAGGDPLDSGLNKNTLLGKIIRIDVDNPPANKTYGIPPDNPFVGEEDARPENYAYGIRNIWRCSIDRGDRETGYGKGRIICGDVGQSQFEEIDIIVKGGNYGWRAREGFVCYNDAQCNDEWLADEILPIHAYPHSVGKSVTGGYVYRGCQSPNLNDKYIFGDYVSGRLFYLIENNVTDAWDSQEICMGDSSICLGNLVNSYPKNILSFGEDEAGEVYMLATNFASTTHNGGQVFKLVDPSRRGNPSECFGEKETVDVNGPTIDFTPSDPPTTNTDPAVISTTSSTPGNASPSPCIPSLTTAALLACLVLVLTGEIQPASDWSHALWSPSQGGVAAVSRLSAQRSRFVETLTTGLCALPNLSCQEK